MDTDNKKPGVLSIDRSKTLSLGKTVSDASAPGRSSFAKGKTVMVEVRKNRNLSTPATPQPVQTAAFAPVPASGGSLTDNERNARLKALQNASTTKIYDAAEVAAKIQEEQRVPIKQPVHESLVAPVETPSEGAMRLLKKASDRLSIPVTAPEKEKPSRKTSAYEDESRFRGKLTVVQALEKGEERTRSMASIRRAREKAMWLSLR